MKLKSGFITQNVSGEYVVVGTGETGFNGIATGNDTSAFIIEQLKSETDREHIISAMLERYDAERDVIEKDVDKVLDGLRSIGAIDE
ncbi:MAG: PqqD family protein [Oscillospiraceae bacterium]